MTTTVRAEVNSRTRLSSMINPSPKIKAKAKRRRLSHTAAKGLRRIPSSREVQNELAFRLPKWELMKSKCADMPILGIIYFFLRGRVGIDHPEKVSDIARTFILLRPIPGDANLAEGPIGDAGNSRLVAIPKKRLPKTGRDRWIAFVEKTNASFEDLKSDFLPANNYETKTAGVRHSPPAVPIGQGVYALTTTGRESHLAYMVTLPHRLGQVQTTLGLEEKGSWILSTRNPQYPAPNNTALPKGPEYSQEVRLISASGNTLQPS
jgi:hypothetical protein